jgi:hypothetical protein
MNSKSALTVNSKSIFRTIISCVFGVLAIAIGLVNTFWGNDPFFGLFILLSSLIYFPPADKIIKTLVGFSIPPVLKILLAAFIIIAALGVGELFAKIELMMKDF